MTSLWGVLRILNVAPTQLHPNLWTSLQAFKIICDIFKIIPTPQLFLFYYNSGPSTPVSWLSLSSRPESVWFVAFTTSYKFFKEKYLEPNGQDYFYNTKGQTKFPFHGTQNPSQIAA